MCKSWKWGLIGALLVVGCKRDESRFILLRADHSTSALSKYPLAVDSARVGTYPAETKSGSGHFYDDVLEYRVWLHPEKGAVPANGDHDYYVAFAQYERAEEFSKASPGVEEPLVLIRQLEWIDEPETGHYIPKKGTRISEWQVRWLPGAKRGPDSIAEFMKHPRLARD